MAFALGYYHWFCLAQPLTVPERLIGADPEDWFDLHTARAHATSSHPEALADYLAALRDPARPRASARTTAPPPRSTRSTTAPAARRAAIACPLLALWGSQGQTTAGTTRWRSGAIRGPARSAAARVNSGHYLAEEAPEEALVGLDRFL